MTAINTLAADLKAALSDFSDVQLHGRAATQYFKLPDLTSDATLRGERVVDVFRLPAARSIYLPVLLEGFEEIIHGYVLSDQLRSTPLKSYLKDKFKWARYPVDLMAPTGRIDEAVTLILWLAQKTFGGELEIGRRTILYRRPDTGDVRGVKDGRIISRYSAPDELWEMTTDILGAFQHGVPMAARFRASPAEIERHLMAHTGGEALVQGWRLLTVFSGITQKSVRFFMPTHLADTVLKGERGAPSHYPSPEAGRRVGLLMKLARKIDQTGQATISDLKTAHRLMVPAFCTYREFQTAIGNPYVQYKDMKLITVRMRVAIQDYVINKNPKKGTP